MSQNLSFRLLSVFHAAGTFRLSFQLMASQSAEPIVIFVKWPVERVHAYPRSVSDVFAVMLGLDLDSRAQIYSSFLEDPTLPICGTDSEPLMSHRAMPDIQ
jgi:hypothetical protein